MCKTTLSTFQATLGSWTDHSIDFLEPVIGGLKRRLENIRLGFAHGTLSGHGMNAHALWPRSGTGNDISPSRSRPSPNVKTAAKRFFTALPPVVIVEFFRILSITSCQRWQRRSVSKTSHSLASLPITLRFRRDDLARGDTPSGWRFLHDWEKRRIA